MQRNGDSAQEPWLWQSNGDHPRKEGRSAHFLEPPFGDPIPLAAAAGGAVVVGRDPGCTIRISSPSVSRRHAEIRFRGTPPRAYLSDLGTKNGTRLSGAPVCGERTLDSGDVIRFGDVTAIYRVIGSAEPRRVAVPKPEPPPPDDTTTELAESGEELSSGLAGDARLVPLDGLLGRLTIVRASGRLEVAVDGTVGFLVLEEGSIVRASFGGREGSVAIRAIAALRRGQFRYREVAPSAEPGITPPHGNAPVVEERGATFAREGGTWLLALPGGAAVRVVHVRGLAMIERLLARPWDPLESTCRHASLSIL